jgi:uncharacterized membrane protein
MEKYILGLIIYLVLDISWIYLNNKMYTSNIENIQNSTFKLNIYAALLSYVIISLYLIFLIYNDFSLINCVLISFFIYSIYNLTNLSTFQNYSAVVAIIDTIWGTTVTFITMYIVHELTLSQSLSLYVD